MPSPCIPSRRGKARVGLIANTAAAGLVLGANRPGHGEDKRPLLYKPMRFVCLLFLASRFAPKIWQEVRVMTRTFPSYPYKCIISFIKETPFNVSTRHYYL